MIFIKIIRIMILVFISEIPQYALQAGMSPLAFKNVSKCFNSGYEWYNPIFGSIALSSGIITNLRFYNVVASIDAHGKRDYINDTIPASDHVMTIIKILFPSPAGQLTTETSAKNNFGSFCKPEHIAALLNFTHGVRTFLSKETNGYPNKLVGKAEKIWLDTQQPNISSIFPEDSFKSTESIRNSLLTAIARAIEREVRPPKKIIGPQFYPSYIVEQILNAFFCHKFSDQQDLKALLQGLNENIVDKAKIAAIDGLLKENDIQLALDRLNTNSIIDFDDIWLICNRQIFTKILPYENHKKPISNALVSLYQRSSNTLSDLTFPDCVEVTLRHIINFMLYNSNKNIFDMTTLTTYMSDKNNSYIQNVYGFYAAQLPYKANAGDTIIRSKWNKCVADLGNNIIYKISFDPKSSSKDNEIKSGIINIMRVFNVLFSLNLKSEPMFSPGEELKFKEDVENWLIDGLKICFNVLNSNYTYDITCSNIDYQADKKDLIGNINVITKNTAGKKIFSFIICVENSHTFIRNLELTQSNSVELPPEKIEFIKKEITHFKNTIIPSLLLTDTNLQMAGNLVSIDHPFYLMFSENIDDSDSMINALENVYKLLIADLISKDSATNILKNILLNIPWSDGAIMYRVTKKILNLKEFIQSSVELDKILSEYTKGLFLIEKGDLDLLNFFKNIENVYAGALTKLEIIDLTPFNKIKKIESKSYKLKAIQFPIVQDKLEEINLADSGIETLKVPSSNNLKKINLAGCSRLKDLIFQGPIPALQEIILDFATIGHLQLSQCTQLRRLRMFSAEATTLIFPTSLENLETIDLSYSKIENLVFPPCLHLNSINLNGTEDLQTITFTGPMPNLTVLLIENSNVQSITGIDFCTNLDISKLPKNIVINQNLLKQKLKKLHSRLHELKSHLLELSHKLILLKKAFFSS